MTDEHVTAEVAQWLGAQATAETPAADVLAALVASGWSETMAATLMQTVFEPRRTAHLAAIDGCPAPLPEFQPSVQARVQLLASLADPRILMLGGFLSNDECAEMIALARSRLARSETVETATGAHALSAARTSEGMFFERGENPLCRAIEERIATVFQWPVDHGEGLQVLRYGPGAEYLPHYDYFDPAQPGTPRLVARGGQRVATLLMYLNTPQAGGATTFPDIGLETSAVCGHAVFFRYPHPDPGSRTLHGGAPVTAGEKWVATKWLRAERFV